MKPLKELMDFDGKPWGYPIYDNYKDIMKFEIKQDKYYSIQNDLKEALRLFKEQSNYSYSILDGLRESLKLCRVKDSLLYQSWEFMRGLKSLIKIETAEPVVGTYDYIRDLEQTASLTELLHKSPKNLTHAQMETAYC